MSEALYALTGAQSDTSAGATLETGVVLARRAIAAWSGGDLAGALNALEAWADEVQAEFPGLDYDDADEGGEGGEEEEDGPPVVTATSVTIEIERDGEGFRVTDNAPDSDGEAYHATFARADGDASGRLAALEESGVRSVTIKNSAR